MVGKVTIFLTVGLIVAFLLAGGGAVTKDAIDKTKTELSLVRSGISARTSNTKDKIV